MAPKLRIADFNDEQIANDPARQHDMARQHLADTICLRIYRSDTIGDQLTLLATPRSDSAPVIGGFSFFGSQIGHALVHLCAIHQQRLAPLRRSIGSGVRTSAVVRRP